MRWSRATHSRDAAPVALTSLLKHLRHQQHPANTQPPLVTITTAITRGMYDTKNAHLQAASKCDNDRTPTGPPCPCPSPSATHSCMAAAHSSFRSLPATICHNLSRRFNECEREREREGGSTAVSCRYFAHFIAQTLE
jgi:hypothetical protein